MRTRSLAVAVSLAASAAACHEAPRHPAILIGVDGLEWSVMLPLLHEDKLPVLQRLMTAGVFGRLETFRPTSSPVIWTSMATGKGLREHGIEGFAYRDPETRTRKLYTSGHRRTKAFWNILSERDLIVDCIGWWNTFPVEEISGTMVAQTNTANRRGRAIWKGSVLKGVEGQVRPDSRQDELMSIVEAVQNELPSLTRDVFGDFEHPFTELDRRLWDNTQWSFRADAIYLRMARRILESREPYDLLAIYLGGPDVTGHRFWRYMYPEEFSHPPTLEQIENFGEVIPTYYRWIDSAIGRLLEKQPEDVTVFVVSDHGMHATNRDEFLDPDAPPNSINSGHHSDAPPGVFIASGYGVAANSSTLPERADVLETIGSVMDITPTLLALKGIPIGADMPGRVLTTVLDTGFLERHPVATIETHDTSDWIESREIRGRDARVEQERLEQLRSLGYIQ